MARDLTAEEFSTIRQQLQSAQSSNDQARQITTILSVLDTFVDLFGESAGSTIAARSQFDQAAGRSSTQR